MAYRREFVGNDFADQRNSGFAPGLKTGAAIAFSIASFISPFVVYQNNKINDQKEMIMDADAYRASGLPEQCLSEEVPDYDTATFIAYLEALREMGTNNFPDINSDGYVCGKRVSEGNEREQVRREEYR